MNMFFGGDWTREKLEKLQAYLVAYRRIFTTNPKAKFFATWYVDAFAGTGTHSLTSQSSARTLSLMEDSDTDEDRGQFLDGSARIALGLQSPFDNYLFVEKSREKADTLRSMISQQFPKLLERVQIRIGE
ncbi:MAG TPA: three-Cys-motif partner protein TcmP [Acidobacteriaceae bacterium]|nr:three-Cys-motif partner protein TcmP [Acidobacteriaceae bacterium]